MNHRKAMALPCNVMKTSKFGDSSTHLVKPLLSTGLLVKKFLLMFGLNVPTRTTTRSWWLLSLVIPSEEFLSPVF